MKRRPLVIVFLSFAGGIILAKILGVTSLPRWFLGGICASFVLLLVLERMDRRGRTALVILTLLFLGISFYGSRYFDPSDLYPRVNTLHTVAGQVVSYPKESPEGAELTLKPDKYPGKLKVFLRPTGHPELNYGDRLIIGGNFEVPTKFGGFNYREFLRKKRIWGVVYEGKIVESGKSSGNPILELGWNLRKLISARIESLFPKRGNFLKALLFGTREALSGEVENSFTRTGLAHLLAASGLHLGIVLGVSWWIASRLGLDRNLIYPASLILLFFYLIVVGFKLPLLRASLIYLFGGAHLLLNRTGLILNKWYDRYQALAGAALILVILSPEAVSTVGFQLSFGATFALAAFFDPLKQALPVTPDYLRGVLAASVAAQLGVMPVLAVHFHRIHPWAPLVNLLAIPGVTLVLYLGILTLALGKAMAIFSGLVWVEGKIIFVYQLAVERLSRLPLTQIQVPRATPLALISYFVLLYWFKRQLSSRGREERIS